MPEKTPLYYGDYLQLKPLLKAQVPLTKAHDEMLFIITHQAYELWFKQIIHDLESILAMFSHKKVPEECLGLCVQRIRRITRIFALLLEQIDVLETMTPLDFLDFRDALHPASGFQSVQFRLLGLKLGLPHEGMNFFLSRLSKEDQSLIESTLKSPPLLELIESWLERTPFLSDKSFSFWKSYRKTVTEILAQDKKRIEHHPHLSRTQKQTELANWKQTHSHFESLFDERLYEKSLDDGQRRLSQKAMLAALLIQLYRDYPLFYQPFQLLHSLVDLDEVAASWRYRHSLMASRMLGTKIGTGGTTGHQYLLSTVESHKIFKDLASLASFLIPRSKLPDLPQNIKGRLNYAIDHL